MSDTKLIFELSRNEQIRKDFVGDLSEEFFSDFIPEKFLRKKTLHIPDLSEIEVVRHYTNLSKRNFSVDTNFYPLGSCTMKYNPKVNERIANFEEFTNVHPYVPQKLIQGFLEILYNSERSLSEICGMKKFSLQPSAGAHGELTGMLITKAYFEFKREKRNTVIVPDSSHGTNPASASFCGYTVIQVSSNSNGLVDINDLKSKVNSETACLMLTNPNTLGLFEKDILEISRIIHSAGGLLYYDGANMNALLGKCRPGDMGFDIVHLNLHKTFSTPHGGGGPGGGAVGVCEKLVDFLPVPLIDKEKDNYFFDYDIKNSIGRVKSFYGNIPVIVKASAYLLSLGKGGLKNVSENAVLNANYLLKKLKEFFDSPFGEKCMHEFVLSAKQYKEKGINARHIAKRLMDFGFHPPTIYFPLIVEEAMMFEPTETESKETLDDFVNAIEKIILEIEKEPEKVKNAPYNTPVSQLDEVTANRQPILKWKRTGD